MAAQNYTLGRGRIFFSRFVPGTQTPAGFRYIGNSPEFNLTIETETLDHFSSDEGIREKDDSVPLEVTRTGTFSTDNIVPENIALFFFGSSEIVTQAVIASHDEVFDAQNGMAYQLGLSPTNHVGARGITEAGFAVEAATAGVLTPVTDYVMDFATGLLQINDGVLADEGEELTVTWASAVGTRERVISGSEPVEGAMRYVAANPKGRNYDYILPYVKITPNGDYALKGDEWQVIPFNIEALKPAVGEAIYVDGRPL